MIIFKNDERRHPSLPAYAEFIPKKIEIRDIADSEIPEDDMPVYDIENCRILWKVKIGYRCPNVVIIEI